MIETQWSIARWADATFGNVTNLVRAVDRTHEEFAELQDAVTFNEPPSEVVSEIADVMITLYRLADVVGCDIHEEINRKMAKNRLRRWRSDGTGHGQHIKE